MMYRISLIIYYFIKYVSPKKINPQTNKISIKIAEICLSNAPNESYLAI